MSGGGEGRRTAITADQARLWRESLGLSVTAAGQALNLSNPNVTFRAYERPGGKTPAPPTVALMDTIACVAMALTKMRDGDAGAAEGYLLAALPEPVLNSMGRARKVPEPPPPPPDRDYPRG